jgi:hypothetical protein
MPPLVVFVLSRVVASKLIRHIHTSHVSLVMNYNWGRMNGLLRNLMPPFHKQICENTMLKTLIDLLSYQVIVVNKLDACILHNMSPLSIFSLAKVNARGHSILLVLVVPNEFIPFNIKSQQFG